LNINVFNTPAWLEPRDIASRLGPSNLDTRQAAILTNLLAPARLNRFSESELADPANAYPLAEYLSDLKSDVFAGTAPDANRRMLQRVYVERLAAMIEPPAPTPAAGGRGGGAGGGGAQPSAPPPFMAQPNIPRSDLPALARAQLRQIRDEAKRNATSASGAVAKAHWQDLSDRVDGALEPRKR